MMLPLEITNSSGIRINILFQDDERLASFKKYHEENQKLRALKGELSESLKETKPPYDYRKLLDSVSNTRAIFTELSRFAVSSWENSCSDATCKITLDLWEKEAVSSPFTTLFLAESVIYRREGQPMVEIIVDAAGVANYSNMNDVKVVSILGLGPSGCGKSYLAKQLFPCIEYAQTVVSNDGGTTRECSNVWMIATSMHAPRVNIGNFYNMFKKRADNKDYMNDLLKDLRVCVYIPDTWVSVYAASFLGTKIKDAVTHFTKRDIDGEQPYIGVLIMQHCSTCGKQCPFKDLYRCVGCDTSGLKRALIEGKKWENKNVGLGVDTYSAALTQGYLTLFTPKYGSMTTCPIFVHNAGVQGKKSIVAHGTLASIDLSKLDPSNFHVQAIPKFPDQFKTFEDELVKMLSPQNTLNVKRLPPGHLSEEQLKEQLFSVLNAVNENLTSKGQPTLVISQTQGNPISQGVVTEQHAFGGRKFSKKRRSRRQTRTRRRR